MNDDGRTDREPQYPEHIGITGRNLLSLQQRCDQQARGFYQFSDQIPVYTIYFLLCAIKIS